MKEEREKKASKIYEYGVENKNESLRSIARKFETSHAQVKRIFEREGIYPKYKTVTDRDSDTKSNVDVTFFKPITINMHKFNRCELCLADLHIPYHDEDIVAAVLKYGLELNPDIVVYLGDLLDFYQISKYNKDPDSFNIDYELRVGRQFLTEMRDKFGDASHYYIEGNHELRLRNFLFTKAPALAKLRALQFGAPDMLDLFNLDIEYVQTREWLNTYEEPFKIGKLYHLHGDEFIGSGSVHVARNTALKALDNVIVGHHHTIQNALLHGLGKEKLIGGWAVGCLCTLFPDWMPINRWMNGFAEIHYSDDGRFHIINHAVYKHDDVVSIF